MIYIQTHSGICFDLLEPNPDSVSIEDIAYSLTALPRYTGHSRLSWSVAQHSLLCCLEAVERELPLDDTLVALLHDATEAYLGDMSSPLKSLCPEYREHEGCVWAAIAKRFRLPLSLPYAVKEIDRDVLMWEAPLMLGTLKGDGWPDCYNTISADPTLIPQDPKDVYNAFLGTFGDLQRARSWL